MHISKLFNERLYIKAPRKPTAVGHDPFPQSCFFSEFPIDSTEVVVEALMLMGCSGRVSLDARRRPAEWSAGRRMRMVDPIGVVGCIRPAIANDSDTRSGDAVPWDVGKCWILVERGRDI